MLSFQIYIFFAGNTAGSRYRAFETVFIFDEFQKYRLNVYAERDSVARQCCKVFIDSALFKTSFRRDTTPKISHIITKVNSIK